MLDASNGTKDYVVADFARQLELELAESKREIEQFEKALLDEDRRKLEQDKTRLDWLSDPANTTGNVLLPSAIVERNLDSLRNAIDEAMAQDAQERHDLKQEKLKADAREDMRQEGDQ
jgi:hypothetical protein